jgi:hypothetical protein
MVTITSRVRCNSSDCRHAAWGTDGYSLGLGKRIRNPSSDHDEHYNDHHHYYDCCAYDHNHRCANNYDHCCTDNHNYFDDYNHDVNDDYHHYDALNICPLWR